MPEDTTFAPKRVLILTKLTRLDYERRTHPHLNDEQLAKLVSAISM